MSYSVTDASILSALFSGNTTAYGVTVVGEVVNGKAQSNSKLIYGTPTLHVWQQHLAGEVGIGIAPLRDDDTCFFGAIDIDNYEYNLLDIVRAIYDFNIPLVPCYSKSQKLHLYAFFADPTGASDVVEYLKRWAAAFGCNPKTEIFPKQVKTTAQNKFYSWINMPYFNEGDEANWRKVIDKDGTPIPLTRGLEIMQEKKITYEEHMQWWKDYPYGDAPTCILSGLLLRDIGPGLRNNWLFNVGVYLQLKDQNADLASLLYEVNKSLAEPLPDNELQATIVKGFQRKTYYYNCSQMMRCNKLMCRQQEWGIDSKASTGLEYGQLTQYMTDPPYYEWIVNGQKLSFWSEQEILGQKKFRALCLRQLHLVPRQVADDVWSNILTKAAENINVVDGVTEGDFTAGSTFTELVGSFFRDKRRADNITQVSLGRVFEDDGEFVFMARPFMDFITQKNNFTSYTPAEIRSRLAELGAYRDEIYWRIPKEKVPVDHTPEVHIDFKIRENEDDAF